MTTVEKRLAALTAEDVQDLVAARVPEGRRIEYKQKLPGRNDADKREFLADISAFANSSGGDLLFGIKEEDGLPIGIPGINPSVLENEHLRLETILSIPA
jgi:predicted HTH transcriptional regulator